MNTCNHWNKKTNILQFLVLLTTVFPINANFTFFSLFSFCRTPLITVLLFCTNGFSSLNTWLLCFVITATSRTGFEHNDIIFQIARQILLFPSNGTWSARLERLTRAYIFMPGVGNLAGTNFFISLFLILVPHCGNKPNLSGHVWHLKKVNLPASDSTLFLLYLHVAASTWEKWERNTVDVVYITNPPTSITLSNTKKIL